MKNRQKKNWEPRPVNTNWRPGPSNTNWGRGAGNTNTLPLSVKIKLEGNFSFICTLLNGFENKLCLIKLKPENIVTDLRHRVQKWAPSWTPVVDISLIYSQHYKNGFTLFLSLKYSGKNKDNCIALYISSWVPSLLKVFSLINFE